MSARDETHGCEVPTADLGPLADGAPHAHGLDAHVAGCPHCQRRLTALRGQRDALCSLAEPASQGPEPAGAPHATPWIPAAVRAGRKAAADLLAELARACLSRSEPEARRAPLHELPRPLERIVADLRLLRARLRSLDEDLPLAGLPDLDDLGRRPHGTPALARACLDALLDLEGPSARHDRLRARCD
ncbi:MAG: hypothetical protein ACYTG2_14150 [Planctomycetota bacterium]|jgi:hypothetical protein